MGFINMKKRRKQYVKTLLNENGHHNAGNKKIINVANPTQNGDAINLSYLNSIQKDTSSKIYFATTNTRQNLSGNEWTTINHLRITFPSLLKPTLSFITSSITINENVHYRITLEVNEKKIIHHISGNDTFHFATNKTKGNEKTVTYASSFLLPLNTTNIYVEAKTSNKRNSNNNTLIGNLCLHMYETESFNHIVNNHGIYMNAKII